jgi:hypothetical protein
VSREQASMREGHRRRVAGRMIARNYHDVASNVARCIESDRGIPAKILVRTAGLEEVTRRLLKANRFF